jgi:hypothetical protein
MEHAHYSGELSDALLAERLHSSPHDAWTAAKLCTITLHIPLIQNPNKYGIRMPMSLGKIRTTLRELQARFSGFTLSFRLGWCADDRMWDPHLCIDVDTQATVEVERDIQHFKNVLEHRFQQRSIYMKISSPIKWVPEAESPTPEIRAYSAIQGGRL